MRIVSIEKANGVQRWLNLEQLVEIAFLKDKKRVRLEFANSSQIIVMREDFDKWEIECDDTSSVIEFPGE
jgi:hypothetical protein